MTMTPTLKMDKTAFSVCSLTDAADESDEKAYWREQTPEQRLHALEFLRQVMYGYDPSADRCAVTGSTVSPP